MLTIPDGEYRAAWIVPVAARPIHNGWLTVQHGTVVELGAYSVKRSSGSFTDLGDVAVLPGLINAHTHLEFSDLKFPIGTPGLPLPEWIGQVVRHRQQLAASSASSQVLATRAEAIAMGLEESAACGVAVVGEIATIGTASDDFNVKDHSHLPAVHCFTEILGLTENRAEQCLEWATRFHHEVSNSSWHDRHHFQIGYSPHAPYSVPLDLLTAIVKRSQSEANTVAMHVAESLEEIELVETGKGPFLDILQRIAPSSSSYFPVQGGLDRILEVLAKPARCLLVHGNYLNTKQIEYIAQRPQFSIVYCPRTHHFFGHALHPVSKLLEAGVNVCLGTDSRASNPDLSVWREAQFLRETRPDISPMDLLRMTTINSASAIGAEAFGTIAAGKPAKLIQVPLASQSSNPNELLEALFDQTPKTIE